MKKKQMLDLLIAGVAGLLCGVSLLQLEGTWRWLSAVTAGLLAVGFLLLALEKLPVVSNAAERSSGALGIVAGGARPAGTVTKPAPNEGKPGNGATSSEAITQLALLSETDEVIATWEMYGKTSLVIGRDVGENQVNVNLSEVSFASMIDREHAVLNYSGGNWYVEDLGSKNGISIMKRDGRKYRLSADKACLLGTGDILYIAMTRLKLR